MIIITGGAGFIGSNLVSYLNKLGIENILIVDSLGIGEKWKNLVGKKYIDFIHKNRFLTDLISNKFHHIEAIIHLGACSSTTEKDADYLLENNFHYSRDIILYAIEKKIKLIYASSAATYGAGEQGYSDENEITPFLKPLNMYGYSKQMLDEFVLRNNFDKKVIGLKFFNVYGPNEYHKKSMCSMVYKAFHQIRNTGKVALFKSNNPDFEDGKQLRDFVYVKDCVRILHWFMQNNISGIYNLGTGVANSWVDLMQAVFQAMNVPPKIEFIPMPDELQNKYQNFTQAKMTRFRKHYPNFTFTNLEKAVEDYVQNYLQQPIPYA